MENEKQTVEDRLASLDEKIDRLVAAKVGAEIGRIKGLPQMPFRAAWAQWEREELTPEGRRSLRYDVGTCFKHKAKVLDLAFAYEGRHLCSLDKRKEEPCTAAKPHVHLGDFPVNELSTDVGAAWFKQLSITERTLPRRGSKTKYYTPGTLNRTLTVALACLSARHGKANNPLRGIEREKEDPDVRAGCFFREEEELEDFLRYAPPTLRDMGRLSTFAGGMRAKEVRLLRIDQVRWDTRDVVLPDSERGGERFTKTGKGREFPLLDPQYEMLCGRRMAAESLGTPYLFPNPQPKYKRDPEAFRAPIPIETLTHWMTAAADRWQPKLLNGKHRPIFHAFRHTFGTWGCAKGIPIVELMRQGGWTDPKIAARYMQQAKQLFAVTRKLMSVPMRVILERAQRRQEGGDE